MVQHRPRQAPPECTSCAQGCRAQGRVGRAGFRALQSQPGISGRDTGCARGRHCPQKRCRICTQPPAALRLVSRQPGDCLTSAGTSSSSEAVSGLLPQSDSDSSRTVQGSEGSGRRLSRPQPLRILVDARTAPEDFTCPDSPPSPEPDRVLEHRGSIARFVSRCSTWLPCKASRSS